jgi:signal transduction histidine kinase
MAVEKGRGHASSIRTAMSDITERKLIEEAHTFLTQSGWTASGEDFFQELARYLALSLHMDYVCIDRLQGDLLAAETVAVYFDGKFEDNVAYTLKDTPCGDVVGRMICSFPRDVRNLFPRDAVLQDMLAESYVGSTLWSSQGKPIGLIALIGRKPLADPRVATSILRLVSVRAAGELERRQTEEALRKVHLELERRAFDLDEVNRELESFSSAVSYGLKAPLRRIEGFVHALMDEYSDGLDETGRDYLSRAHSASQRMTQLIEALLNMARLTREKLQEDVVNLSSIAQVTAHELQIREPRRRATFVIAEKIRVQGDQVMLQIMLRNLLDNSWKFSARHDHANIEFGVINCGMRNADCGLEDKKGQSNSKIRNLKSEIVYFVRDDGAGFDMAYADKLFGPFQRLHAESEFPGLGIGLAIAHRIIIRHGGRMWAEAAPEKGATFYFTL